ncbi:hypothetical protein ACFQS1_03525 [Paractinoplanes rhizophilus]|uniref:Tetratricopeptide repeat protein n=1 Tax=Paractinoplanes rhizophilus TaxID=1416877 RepID=A0ABW2HM11_9ACTN
MTNFQALRDGAALRDEAALRDGAALRDEAVASALELANGGRWERALALLDAMDRDVPSALAAAEVALDQDWWAGTDTAGERLAEAERAGAHGWALDFLRLRHDYLRLIHPAGETFQPGPWGKDPEAIAAIERQGELLRRTAPGRIEAGWAEMYLGLIADNVRADREAAPPHYEAALAASGKDAPAASAGGKVSGGAASGGAASGGVASGGVASSGVASGGVASGGDALLAREALRHLGDHDHDRGDHALALDRWRRATALGAGAGRVTGTLSQQLLLAVLARDAGDEAGAVALATEIERWADALGATRIRDNATAFLAGVDPTAAPEDAAS